MPNPTTEPPVKLRSALERWRVRYKFVIQTIDRCDSARAYEIQNIIGDLESGIREVESLLTAQAQEIEQLKALIANDGYAMSFLTLRHYREALLAEAGRLSRHTQETCAKCNRPEWQHNDLRANRDCPVFVASPTQKQFIERAIASGAFRELEPCQEATKQIVEADLARALAAEVERPQKPEQP